MTYAFAIVAILLVVALSLLLPRILGPKRRFSRFVRNGHIFWAIVKRDEQTCMRCHSEDSEFATVCSILTGKPLDAAQPELKYITDRVRSSTGEEPLKRQLRVLREVLQRRRDEALPAGGPDPTQRLNDPANMNQVAHLARQLIFLASGLDLQVSHRYLNPTEFGGVLNGSRQDSHGKIIFSQVNELPQDEEDRRVLEIRLPVWYSRRSTEIANAAAEAWAFVLVRRSWIPWMVEESLSELVRG